jgi:hypothetical protein
MPGAAPLPVMKTAYAYLGHFIFYQGGGSGGAQLSI